MTARTLSLLPTRIFILVLPFFYDLTQSRGCISYSFMGFAIADEAHDQFIVCCDGREPKGGLFLVIAQIHLDSMAFAKSSDLSVNVGIIGAGKHHQGILDQMEERLRLLWIEHIRHVTNSSCIPQLLDVVRDLRGQDRDFEIKLRQGLYPSLGNFAVM